VGSGVTPTNSGLWPELASKSVPQPPLGGQSNPEAIGTMPPALVSGVDKKRTANSAKPGPANPTVLGRYGSTTMVAVKAAAVSGPVTINEKASYALSAGFTKNQPVATLPLSKATSFRVHIVSAMAPSEPASSRQTTISTFDKLFKRLSYFIREVTILALLDRWRPRGSPIPPRKCSKPLLKTGFAYC
jgi:hypothetical protein